MLINPSGKASTVEFPGKVDSLLRGTRRDQARHAQLTQPMSEGFDRLTKMITASVQRSVTLRTFLHCSANQPAQQSMAHNGSDGHEHAELVLFRCQEGYASR